MLVFISPLRHPESTTDYNKTLCLLRKTLNSICQQSDPDFRVVVVCNQVPPFSNFYEKVEFLQVNFPNPETIPELDNNKKRAEHDKGTKYAVGLAKAKEYSPNHVMLFDSDDLLSKEIAGIVNSNKETDGWIIKNGYIMKDGSLLVSKTNRFNRECGSCNIARFDLLNPPAGITPQSDQATILRECEHEFLNSILGNHKQFEAFFKKKGCALQPFPKRAAIWVLDNGVNHSGRRFFGYPRIISQEIESEFGIETDRSLKAKLVAKLIALPSFFLRQLIHDSLKFCFYSLKRLTGPKAQMDQPAVK